MAADRELNQSSKERNGELINLLEPGDDGGELDEPLVDLLPPPPLRDDVVLHRPRRR